MLRRTCAASKPNGERCRANPLRENVYCLMHDPDHAEDVAEARKLGGFRKRREVAVIGAYDLEGLDSLTFLERVLAIAMFDTLGLDNGFNRSRTLGYLVGIGSKLRQDGEVEQRLAALESTVQGQQVPAQSVFDAKPNTSDFSEDEDDTND